MGWSNKHTFSLSLCLVVALFGFPAQAAVFNLTYDDLSDQDINSGNIVGTGSFGYDGAAILGSTLLSDLTGLSFSATINGRTFATGDILTDLSITGINVLDIGSGAYGLVFTGNGGVTAGGSLDLRNSAAELTHEPTAGFDVGLGCCGGDGVTNLYFASGPNGANGDYTATTRAAVPEPGMIGLAGSACLVLGALRRRRRL